MEQGTQPMTPERLSHTQGSFSASQDAALNDCDTLGYRDCHELARSADAVVISGIDASNRPVAVKMFRGGDALASDQEFWDKVDEYGEVRHPNLVAMHQCDPTRGLIVTELLDGNWGKALLSGPLPVSTVAAIARQALEGLKHLHKNGLIHGRISPRTLLRDETKAVTKLAFPDWYRGGANFPLPDVTDRHVAPEILDPAEFGAPNAALDLYCLGTTLIELLMGPEYDLYCDSVTSGASERDLSRAWQGWHANPATAFPTLTKMRRDVPKELAAVIDRLVAKRAADRFASAAEALEDFPEACDSNTADPVRVPASPAANSRSAKTAPPKRSARKARNQLLWRFVLVSVTLVFGVLCFALMSTSQEDDDPPSDSPTGQASMNITSDDPSAELREFDIVVEDRQAANGKNFKVWMRLSGQTDKKRLENLSSEGSIYRFEVPGGQYKKVELIFEAIPDTYQWWIESPFYNDERGDLELKAASDDLHDSKEAEIPLRILKQKLFDLNLTVDFKGAKPKEIDPFQTGLTVKVDGTELDKLKRVSKISEPTTSYRSERCLKIGKRKISVECPDYEPKTLDEYDVPGSSPAALKMELIPLKHPVELKLAMMGGQQIQDLPPAVEVEIVGADASQPVPTPVPLEDAQTSGLQLETGNYTLKLVGLGEDFECRSAKLEVKGSASACELRIFSTKRRVAVVVEPSDATVRILDWKPKGGGGDIKSVRVGDRHELVVAKDLRTVEFEVSHHSGMFKRRRVVVNLVDSFGTDETFEPKPHEEIVRLERLPRHRTTWMNLTRSKLWNIRLENRETKEISQFKLGDRHVTNLIEGVYVLDGVSDSNHVLEPREITIDQSGPLNIYTPAK
jgi:serine/threonine-protein kinase